MAWCGRFRGNFYRCSVSGVFVALILATAVCAEAIGLKTSDGKVRLTRVSLGQPWRLSAGAKESFEVVNTWNEDALITLELSASTTEEMARWDIDHVAATAWFWLPQNKFLLAPGASARADLYVLLPQEKRVLGKKWGCYLAAESQTVSGSAMNVKAQVRVPVVVEISDEEVSQRPTSPLIQVQGGAGAVASLSQGPFSKGGFHRWIGQSLKGDIRLRWLSGVWPQILAQGSPNAATIVPGDPQWMDDPKILEPGSKSAKVQTNARIPQEVAPGYYGWTLEAYLPKSLSQVALASLILEVK